MIIRTGMPFVLDTTFSRQFTLIIMYIKDNYLEWNSTFKVQQDKYESCYAS